VFQSVTYIRVKQQDKTSLNKNTLEQWMFSLSREEEVGGFREFKIALEQKRAYPNSKKKMTSAYAFGHSKFYLLLLNSDWMKFCPIRFNN